MNRVLLFLGTLERENLMWGAKMLKKMEVGGEGFEMEEWGKEEEEAEEKNGEWLNGGESFSISFFLKSARHRCLGGGFWPLGRPRA